MRFPGFLSYTAESLILIRGGTFPIEVRSGFETLRPTRDVTLSSYSIGRSPVTNRQYNDYVSALGQNRVALMEMAPSTGPTSVLAFGESQKELVTHFGDRMLGGGFLLFEVIDHRPRAGWDRADLPVVFLNWYRAMACCAAYGGRLPTEAEWDHAFQRHPMKTIVREWCLDWYAPFDETPVTDPFGPASGLYRIQRYAERLNNAPDEPQTLHTYQRPNLREPQVGFRFAAPVSPIKHP